jgi:hypothetical protein
MAYAIIGHSAAHIAEGARFEVFHHEYQGFGTFSRYGELWLGPLNEYGQVPGIYAHPRRTFIMCDDGVERLIDRYSLNSTTETTQAGLLTEPTIVEPGFKRIDDLPYMDHLWPGDIVEIAEARAQGFGDSTILALITEPLKPLEYAVHIEGLPSTMNHTIRHEQIASEHATVVRKHNVRWLYEDPSQMRFPSDVDELKFWCQAGISKRHHDRNQSELTLFSWNLRFECGDVDFIAQVGAGNFAGYKLHEIFIGRMARVRALTERVFGQAIKDEILKERSGRAKVTFS